MITTALLGLAALAAAPTDDIAAQYAAQTGATNISCTAYDVTYCYGVGTDGSVIGAVYADGAFIPLGAEVAAPTVAEVPAVEAGNFGDGIWLVGDQMAPGNYRATIDSEGIFDFCDYSRLADLSGTDNGEIASYHESGEGEQVLVTIEEGDFAFETNGCGHWSLVG